MDIYFCGSMRGGRDLLAIYQKMIQYLQDNYGNILTPDVGNAEYGENDRFDLPDHELYERDIALLRRAEVVIAEVTVPSMGVGYEVANAEHLSKPMLCLYNKGYHKKLTPMLKGNKNLTIIEYSDFEDLKQIIDNFLVSIAR